MELRKGRHSVSALNSHLVFITKYRGKIFNNEHLETMERLMRHAASSLDVKIIEFNGENDHVHLLIEYPPKLSISKIVNSLKGVSSRKLKMHHPELVKPAYMKDALWSPSYFASSVGGAPIGVLKQYIEQQNRPH
jgi:putative transposase